MFSFLFSSVPNTFISLLYWYVLAPTLFLSAKSVISDIISVPSGQKAGTKQLVPSMTFSKPISSFFAVIQRSYGSRASRRNALVGFTLSRKLFHAVYPQLPPYL